ncbi:hypothetical protein [Flavobacterium aquatile]|uniref:Uncharacterized protein n=1 Tax=Flavobacterium aquatile LMG 4008 = ATCC 11947 TaxID=1453498 RepID=A0A095SQR3_9FLAO|nr:hypothetical protein [Flavobacterium aquatile]KGD66927.1 hypothetical protein LG45_16000 [Flavobacterium aquatile LMG 4008 = ATCC 11947]OXA68020.1 hypothetical protein B0A61_06010 [Flavobacterium aquatile LMG 4008 = ATCC 11947]GEC80140.1 hypothetical protein FAQ01_30100 [Flavobacterium aquatile]
MEQLDDLMDKLNSDKFCAVTVYDRNTSKSIFRNVTHEQIKNEYGSSEEFFERLFADGHTKLSLQEKRKNGSNAFKLEGEPFDVSFGNATEEQEKLIPKKKKKKKKKSGLMGLGMTEIFDLKLQAYDRAELARKLEESERENKELKAKNEALNEEKLQKRYTKESNDSLNNMLLGVAKQAPIILKSLGFNVPIEPNGLGVASADDLQDDNYSDAKKTFLDIVKTLDDDTITLLQVMYQKISEKTENNVFSQELFELLQKHQMIV